MSVPMTKNCSLCVVLVPLAAPVLLPNQWRLDGQYGFIVQISHMYLGSDSTNQGVESVDAFIGARHDMTGHGHDESIKTGLI